MNDVLFLSFYIMIYLWIIDAHKFKIDEDLNDN